MQRARDVLSAIEGFEHPDRIEPLRGLSNGVWLVVLGRDEYVFRVASQTAERLGISREVEGEVLRLAHDAGLGPEVVRHVLPEGHLITRRIPAEPFSETPQRYREPNVLRSIVRTRTTSSRSALDRPLVRSLRADSLEL